MKETSNNDLPLVSMISIFYNRAYCVSESVQSMVDQTYPNLEIILVDDGSTDNTLEELNKFKSSRVKIVSHTNRGFTRSIRETIGSAAHGEYIAIHGSGDYSYPERVARQVAHLRENDTVAACGVSREILDEQTGRVKTKRLDVKIKKGELKTLENPFSQGEVVFKRNFYDRAGGYRDFFHYAQDFDLWLRMNEIGEFVGLPEVLYRQYRRIDGVSKDENKRIKQAKFAFIARHLARNTNHTLERHMTFEILEKELCAGNNEVRKIFLKRFLIALFKFDLRSAIANLRQVVLR